MFGIFKAKIRRLSHWVTRTFIYIWIFASKGEINCISCFVSDKSSWTEWKPPAIKFQKTLNTHCLTSTLLFTWIIVNFCQSCSYSLNVLYLKIICKIWHLTATVCSSDYFLNTYCFIKCTIIFCFHNFLYDHTANITSFFIFPPSSIFTLTYLLSIMLFLLMMPKGEKNIGYQRNVDIKGISKDVLENLREKKV